MDNIKAYAEGFSLKYEKFIHACDSEEEIVQWDVEQDGEMEAYYTNILSSVIICLIAADDEFTENEAEFIYEIFGFTYTPEELRYIYDSCRSGVEYTLENELQSDLDKLGRVNEKLAEYFKELLVLACEVIAASDRNLYPAEQKLIEKISGLKI